VSVKNTRNYRNGLVPNYCEIKGCNFTDFITRHRIKPGRRGGKYVLGNVIALCPNHHAQAELNMFSQKELFEIVQERLSKELGETMNKEVGED
jgi:predicted restriction endonuclease